MPWVYLTSYATNRFYFVIVFPNGAEKKKGWWRPNDDDPKNNIQTLGGVILHTSKFTDWDDLRIREREDMGNNQVCLLLSTTARPDSSNNVCTDKQANGYVCTIPCLYMYVHVHIHGYIIISEDTVYPSFPRVNNMLCYMYAKIGSFAWLVLGACLPCKEGLIKVGIRKRGGWLFRNK